MSIFEGIVPQPNEVGKRLAPMGEHAMKDELEKIIWQSGRQISSAIMHEIAHEEISLNEAAERFVRQCLMFTADCYRAEIAAQKLEEAQEEAEGSEL
jgi:hypothetical protein